METRQSCEVFSFFVVTLTDSALCFVFSDLILYGIFLEFVKRESIQNLLIKWILFQNIVVTATIAHVICYVLRNYTVIKV